MTPVLLIGLLFLASSIWMILLLLASKFDTLSWEKLKKPISSRIALTKAFLEKVPFIGDFWCHFRIYFFLNWDKYSEFRYHFFWSYRSLSLGGRRKGRKKERRQEEGNWGRRRKEMKRDEKAMTQPGREPKTLRSQARHFPRCATRPSCNLRGQTSCYSNQRLENCDKPRFFSCCFLI